MRFFSTRVCNVVVFDVWELQKALPRRRLFILHTIEPRQIGPNLTCLMSRLMRATKRLTAIPSEQQYRIQGGQALKRKRFWGANQKKSASEPTPTLLSHRSAFTHSGFEIHVPVIHLPNLSRITRIAPVILLPHTCGPLIRHTIKPLKFASPPNLH